MAGPIGVDADQSASTTSPTSILRALTRNDANGQPIPTSALVYVDRPGYDTFSGADLRGRVVWLRVMHRF